MWLLFEDAGEVEGDLVDVLAAGDLCLLVFDGVAFADDAEHVVVVVQVAALLVVQDAGPALLRQLVHDQPVAFLEQIRRQDRVALRTLPDHAPVLPRVQDVVELVRQRHVQLHHLVRDLQLLPLRLVQRQVTQQRLLRARLLEVDQ